MLCAYDAERMARDNAGHCHCQHDEGERHPQLKAERIHEMDLCRWIRAPTGSQGGRTL